VSEIVWRPTPESAAASNVGRFMAEQVRAVALGQPAGDLSGLEDPGSLDAIMDAR
jgi:hypothetical protein